MVKDREWCKYIVAGWHMFSRNWFIGGIILGLLAGYYRQLDGIIMRIVDLLFAFPGIY